MIYYSGGTLNSLIRLKVGTGWIFINHGKLRKVGTSGRVSHTTGAYWPWIAGLALQLDRRRHRSVAVII